MTARGGAEVLVDDTRDQRIRWSPGERLDHLFEDVVDRLAAAGDGDRPAVDAGDAVWSYPQLDAGANRLARHLAARGVRSGDRVGLLVDRGVDAYLGMLAVLKLNAAYVPLDAGFPADRIAYICHDAGVTRVVTTSRLLDSLRMTDADVVSLDADAAAMAALPGHRLGRDEREDPREELAYVIYTSGSTGRPKGVAIDHAAICNFVRVAAEVYGVRRDDRFYQGMTIAFDFSVEEIWVPWMVGATLVPRPPGGALVGAELRDFLVERRVTGLSCVPTLLATIDGDVPDLRFLLVSGEACPQDLIARWHRSDRRFLNVYGPTEATVTATWTVLDPARPVTIGTPLPTYSVVLLDPSDDGVVARGQVGEICIAGVGLSPGYVNRPDLTAKAFVPDMHDLPHNPSGRLYRTGDLGRITDDGQIEYHGRIDLQVKIRGYRIELTEIESVLLQVPGIATAVVEPFRPSADVVELAAYWVRRDGADPVDPHEVRQLLRDRLPGYMVPTWYTELDALPMLPSDKVDRKRLPAPDTSQRLGSEEYTPPQGRVETGLARLLAEALGVERVSATADFFDDLGGNSLVMARFCARVREQPGLGEPVMKDVYRHPTVRSLAGALTSGASADARLRPDVPPAGPVARPRRVATIQYVAIAVVQALSFAALCCVSAFMTVALFAWYTVAPTLAETYARSVVFSLVVLGFTFVLPLAAKWTLMGRTPPARFGVWGLTYYRFWIVRQLTRLSPLRLAAGTPLFTWYLRLLGARVGRGAVIHSNAIPAFPDLLSIGARAVVLRGTAFPCYRAESGIVTTGPVDIGAGAFVGGDCVLDIGARVGAGAQLGHASALAAGQQVPDGAHWHGTPAVPTTDDYRTVPELTPRPLAGVLFGLGAILTPVLLLGPAVLLVIWLAVTEIPLLGVALTTTERLPWDSFPLNVALLGASLALVPLGLVGRLVWAAVVPRIVYRLFLRPGVVYPLYGVRFWALRTVRRMTNSALIPLFGDSNYITWLLQWMGYSLRPVRQTGTNFGMTVGHDVPYLVRIGSGTMVSDGLTLMNAEYSSTGFRVRPTVVGRNSFFGNGVVVTPDARIGHNMLLATKVLVPVSGEYRHDVGLLGSPPFEIPRSVARDARFDEWKSGPEHERRLAAKLRYNTATIVWTLLSRWFFTVVTAVGTVWALDLHVAYGWWPLAGVLFCLPLFSVAWFAAVEWITLGFRRLRPQYCSVYDPVFWRHERYWKLGSNVGVSLFDGTPFKAWVWRLLGTRVGRQLFDDGSGFVERSLLTIGDYCTLNQGSLVQSHSLEDGTFKSDRVELGDGCTLAPAAFVHYGARVGAGSVIESDAFLMKGEQVPAGQRWYGNPAMPLSLDAVPAAEPAAEASEAVPAGAVVRPGPDVVGARALANGWSHMPSVPRRAVTQAPRPVRDDGSLVDALRAGPPVVPMPGVAVHLFSLAACRDREERLAALLGSDDARTWASLADQVRRTRFLASRAAVRLLLEGSGAEGRPGDDAAAWWLSTRAGGAPTLHGPGPAVEVSLSYSDDLVAVALAERFRVGVDLAPQGMVPGELPAWVLAPAEQEALAPLVNGHRDTTFLRMWARKEAAAKCLGLGASLAFVQFDTVAGVRRVSEAVVAWDEHRMRVRVDPVDVGGGSVWLATAWQPRPPAYHQGSASRWTGRSSAAERSMAKPTAAS